MKRIQRLLTVVAFMLAAAPAFAQLNVGYCNTDSIIVKMPEYQTAMAQLEALSAQYRQEIQDLRAEITSKIQNAQANRSTWTQLRLQKEAEEIQTMQNSLEAYQQEAQQDLMTQERALLEPVVEKLQEAVNSVGTENGYDYILDSSVSRGVVIFRKDSHDISQKVLAKLGLI